MDTHLQQLLEITDALHADLQDQRHETCADLLRRREDILQVILAEYGPDNKSDLPDELRSVLNRIRQVDAEMEAMLKQQMSETGREMTRASDIKKSIKKQPSSCCLNRQA
jgi:hypothetical protein